MAIETFFVSSLVMGALVVATAFAIIRGRNWHQAPSNPTESGELWLFRAGERVGEFIRTPLAWGLAFAVLIAVFGGGTVLVLSGQMGTGALLAMAAVGGLVVAIYLFYGAYASIRLRGIGNAGAVAAGSWAVGMLFLLVLVVKLLVG